jgi:hypothetical protein
MYNIFLVIEINESQQKLKTNTQEGLKNYITGTDSRDNNNRTQGPEPIQ